MKKYKVGVLGATGTVGRRFVSLLENHPFFDLTILAASQNSAGKTYREALGHRLSDGIKIPEKFYDFKILDAKNDAKKVALSVNFVFSAISMPKTEIRLLEETYTKFECPVISNNSAHRSTPDVPLIIPEINTTHLEILKSQQRRLKTKRGFIVVKPNCSLQCYLPAVHPLMIFKPNKILVCTYQAISGAGKTFDSWSDMKDNLIPYIKSEEEKTENEPLKIWGKVKNDKIINSDLPKISAQCFRVPVSEGHTSAVFVSFKNKPTKKEILDKWSEFEGEPQKLFLPSAPRKFLHYFKTEDKLDIKKARELENGMAISISRLRKDAQYDFKFVCMSHNTLRGAAGGALLTAEFLCKKKYFDF
ncbi:MAG: aspartate-semialdehyde dehydrogenase [Oscillospiraceae bacterium]|jgi:aspartate-semialdehyde dehydrogenase|nr:aspartate-semialdehyde dehydrogenase [Oscillospiraceae bacterium]